MVIILPDVVRFETPLLGRFNSRQVSDPGGGCGRGLVMVEYITPRIAPNGLIFEILHLQSEIFNSGI